MLFKIKSFWYAISLPQYVYIVTLLSAVKLYLPITTAHYSNNGYYTWEQPNLVLHPNAYDV